MENSERSRFILRANKPIRPNEASVYRIALRGAIAFLIALASALGLVVASLQSKPVVALERPTPVPLVTRATNNHETNMPVKAPLPKAMDAAK